MKRRPLSLVVRLTVSIGAVITAVLLTFGWMMERSINNHFVQQDVDELNSVVQALQYLLATVPADIPAEQLHQRLASVVTGHRNAQYRISTDSGSLIYSTPGFNLDTFARTAHPVEEITIDTVESWDDPQETFRGAVLWIDSSQFEDAARLRLAVATGIDFHLHYLDSFRSYLRIVTLVACLIALLATWFAVYQGHAPIRRISREMGRIRSDQLHIRLEPRSVPAELVELTISFNDMIGRLEDVFRRLSDFSGDIAHELRTPITNLRTETEVALTQARSVEQYREVLYSNLEEYDRMAKMVGDMLFLAQADNQLLKPELVEIDLQSELRNLFDYFSAWAEEREVLLENTGEQVHVLGDRLMIRRALSNLLSNAVRHTPEGQSVTTTLQVNSGNVRIRIQNPGPPIPEEHLNHIFERFYRLDASRQRSSEGAGLGLAITKSIIEAHGGKIRAFSTTEATTFEVQLPLKME